MSINDHVIKSDNPDHIFNSIEKVWNSDFIKIGVGIKGSDEGYSLIVDEQGNIVQRVEGLVNQFFYLKGKLCYVKEFRKENSPDGVPPVVERLFCGGEMVPFYPERGEWISAKADGDDLLLVRGIGWSQKVLYLNFKEIDSGDIPTSDMKNGTVYYVKGNSVLGNGRELFTVGNPILDVRAVEDGLIVEQIRDYRTWLVGYDITGKEKWFYKGEHIVTYDVENDSVYVLENSFSLPYQVSKISQGKVEVLRRANEEKVMVKNIYVKGEVLLHGFLLTKGGNRGVIVYGYGGFAIPLLPNYNPLFQELMDSGFSILVTNLRGGFENGEEWHKAGMLRNKMNVFKDFAEFLGLVKAMGGKTIAMGGSNGGLLVGATMNLYPRLIDCGVIGYPVLDMLKYHQFLAGMYWVHEYGDPESYADYLLQYSPYHNLREGLPPTLVYTGLNDDRVHPMHALKYVARSRELGNKVYLSVNMRSGHNLANPKSTAEEMSMITAFIESC
ncbi:prolyl oligopeptidase family serine peptidase [Metallosphaera hakonensis]|uniref:prolyl oligopeptidase family serine peptidase n=1 Tax=Metallosphaera hakonensis TaxID=79601 RepID=UPI000A9B154C|nr:prolyl oligopeptidase family serine peptidase [Metallosphaera hakonensis]